MNLTKLDLHFSDFSVIFYAIYKNQEITFTIGVHLLQQGPWKDFGFCNVVPGRGGRRGVAKFRRGSPGFGRGRAVEGSMGHGRLVSLVGQGGGGAGEQVHRRPGTAAAQCRREAARGSGKASRRAAVREGEGGGSLGRTRGLPEKGARRGRP
jgi:hypothetical protein